MNMLELTQELLKKRDVSLRKVCAGTGVSLSHITKIMQGKAPNAGFATLNKLIDYLTQEEK